MKRRFPFHGQTVWPPAPMVALLVIVYVVLTAGLLLIQFRAGNARVDIFSTHEVQQINLIFLGGAAVLYAIYRLCCFHPACNPAYAAWLRLSPWTSDKPLPLGPVHPVWQDAAVLGVITVVAQWHAGANPALPVAAFGLTYLIGMTVLLAITRRWPSCVMLGFLWPALMLPRAEGWPAVGLFALIILVVWRGHQSSLRAFPWPFVMNFNKATEANRMPPGTMQIHLDGLNGAVTRLGWPYFALSPKIVIRSISTSTSFILSALAGWWTYCVVKSSQMDSLPGLILTFAVVAALTRLAVYCSGVVPPFNVLGRIASGRIVLPGFDNVFLTPLAVVLAGVVGGMIIRRSASCYPAAEAFIMALLLLVLFIGGPSHRKWVLTGRHRFRPPSKVGANNQLLRPV